MPAAMARLGVGSAISLMSRENRQNAMNVWKACQAEGGKFWDYSQDEIAEMMLSKEGLADEIQQILKKRCWLIL